MAVDLLVTLRSGHKELKLPNPIIAASGSFGFGPELAEVVDFESIGAITVKSLAPFESQGNPSPRVAATSVGMMNSVGQPGPDIRDWVKKDANKLADLGGRFIMSFWGKTIDDFRVAARALAPVQHLFEAFEINLSCPNVHGDGIFFAQVPEQTKEIVELVREELGENAFIFSKLTAAVRSVPEISQAAIEGGTDGLTLFNTLLGLDIDVDTRKPILGKGGGGYSGKAVLPIVLRGVYETRKAYNDIPIIGTGGVSNGDDAAKMLICGASAVGLATATFADPRATVEISSQLNQFCENRKISNVSDLTNTVVMENA